MNSAFDAFNARYEEVASVTAALTSGSYRDLLDDTPTPHAAIPAAVAGENAGTGGSTAATGKLT